MKILIKDIINACGGRLLWGNEDGAIEAISLDSRHMEGKDLFVPIAGEKVDAHRFICQAGAAGTHRPSGTGSGLGWRIPGAPFRPWGHGAGARFPFLSLE